MNLASRDLVCPVSAAVHGFALRTFGSPGVYPQWSRIPRFGFNSIDEGQLSPLFNVASYRAEVQLPVISDGSAAATPPFSAGEACPPLRAR